MRSFHIFDTAQEMFDVLTSGVDLYSEEKELYAFSYNEAGSIAVYSLDKDEVAELQKLQEENDDYWSAFLGPGGRIYDDKSHECYEEGQMSNMDFCEENYKNTLWKVVG